MLQIYWPTKRVWWWRPDIPILNSFYNKSFSIWRAYFCIEVSKQSDIHFLKKNLNNLKF